MHATELLLVLAGLARSAYGKWRLRQVLSGMAVAAGLVIIASITASAMLISIFYMGYLMLMESGIDRQAALLVIIATALAACGLCVTLVRRKIHPFLQIAPAPNRAGETIDAFLDGLMGK